MTGLARRLRFGLTLLAATSLAGCNLAPAYHPPTMPVPDHFTPLPGWSEAAPADAAPRGAWWEAFGDPALNAFEARLTADNPDLQAAVARYDQASAYARQARGALLPSASLQGSATRDRQSADKPLRGSGQPDVYSADQANGVVGYELDLWGKLRNQLTSRKAIAQASDADRAAAQLSLQAQLADSYFQLRGLDAQTRLLDDTVALYRKSRDLTAILYRGKLAAQMDVSRAEAQLGTAQAALTEVHSRRALLVDAIAVLVGAMPSDFAVTPADLPPALPTVPEGVPSELLQRRPDIASAERAMASANAGIGVARAAFYPSISFNALGGFQSAGSDPFKASDILWSLGPSINLPIFQGGRLKADLDAAHARFREMSAQYRGTVLRAFREVEDNRVLLSDLAKERVFNDTTVAAATQTSNAASDLYRAGTTSYLDVVTAQTSLFQAQQAALDVRTRQFVAAVDLVRALGGGW